MVYVYKTKKEALQRIKKLKKTYKGWTYKIEKVNPKKVKNYQHKTAYLIYIGKLR